MIEDKYANEMLTNDELDQVTGGSCEETATDSVWLKGLGLMDECYTATDLYLSSGKEKEKKVKAAFEKVGITFVWTGMQGDKNKYYFKGKSYKHKEALALAGLLAEKMEIGIYKK